MWKSILRIFKQQQQCSSTNQVVSDERTSTDPCNEDNMMAVNNDRLTEFNNIAANLSKMSTEVRSIGYYLDDEHQKLDERRKQIHLLETNVTDGMRRNAELHTTTKLESSEDPMSPAKVPKDYDDFFVQIRMTAIEALQEVHGIKDEDEINMMNAYVDFSRMFRLVWHFADKYFKDVQQSLMETLTNDSLLSYVRADKYESKLKELESICKEQFSLMLKRSVPLMNVEPIVLDVIRDITTKKDTGKIYKTFDEQMMLPYIMEAANLCLRMIAQTPKFEILTNTTQTKEQYCKEKHSLMYLQQGKFDPKWLTLYNIKRYTKPMLFRDGELLCKGEVILEETTMNDPNAAKGQRQGQTEDRAMRSTERGKPQKHQKGGPM